MTKTIGSSMETGPKFGQFASALEQAQLVVLEHAGEFTDECLRAAFTRHVASCLEGAADPVAAAQRLHVADVRLAFACAHGDEAAIVEFERRFAGDIERVVSKYPALSGDRSDVVQGVVVRLLVSRPDGSAPRIAEYRGHGPLQGWVRIAALRMVMNLAQSKAGDPLLFGHEPSESRTVTASVEEGYMRNEYAKVVRSAVEAAFARLSARERLLLRHQVVQGLTIDQVAAIYDIHRATAARWIARARERLAVHVRELLVSEHAIAPSAVDSLMLSLASEVDVSVGRLLADES